MKYTACCGKPQYTCSRATGVTSCLEVVVWTMHTTYVHTHSPDTERSLPSDRRLSWSHSLSTRDSLEQPAPVNE